MIRFEIHGENLTITDAIRNYIEEKIGKLERYFNDVPNATAHVKVKTYHNSATKYRSNDSIEKCHFKS